MRRLDCFLILFISFLLLLYFYLYFSTDFRHILISIDSRSSTNKNGDCGKFWPEIMNGPMAQNDSRLLTHIRNNFLNPPSPRHDIYNFSNHDLHLDPSMGQATLIRRALNNLRNGFFVECGAFDGEIRSNTLALERDLGWEGLLIEPDPENFKKLKTKRRKAWSSNVCLSIKPYPHNSFFRPNGSLGKIVENSAAMNVNGDGDFEDDKIFLRVQCLPLFSLLSALNISRIDYLSLDVEGNEMDVLQTIPFDSVYIKTVSVEYIHNTVGRNGVRKWMSSKGFSVFGEVTHEKNLANDWIFINNK